MLEINKLLLIINSSIVCWSFYMLSQAKVMKNLNVFACLSWGFSVWMLKITTLNN